MKQADTWTRAVAALAAGVSVLIAWSPTAVSAADIEASGGKRSAESASRSSALAKPGDWLRRTSPREAKAAAACDSPSYLCTDEGGSISLSSQTVVAYVDQAWGDTKDCRWDVTVDFGDGALGYYEYGFIRTGFDEVFFGLKPSPLVHTYAEPGIYNATVSAYNGHSDSGSWLCPDGSLPLTVQYPSEEGCDGITDDEVLPFDATPPPLSPFPNDDAACAAVWVPRLDDGFVAQGLAFMDDGTALLSGYIHPLGDPKEDRSGEYCRIAHVSLTTGDFLGGFDFRRSICQHGGGIAIDSDGRVWISDTKKLIWLTGSDIFTNPIPIAAKLGKGEGLKGSFLVDGRSDHLWVGIFEKEEDGQPAGKIYEFETDYLVNRAILGFPVKKRATTDVRNVPLKTQGAAFKGDALFAAFSNATEGSLKTDHGTFGFGPGVEEIQFSGECLWAVFEAGARIYRKESFPVIARFDPGLIPNAFDPHDECIPT